VSAYEPYAKYGAYMPARDDNPKIDLNANCDKLKPFQKWNKNTCKCQLNRKCSQKKKRCKPDKWDEKSCTCFKTCIARECVPGKEFNRGTCQCECRTKISCNFENYKWDASSCQCVLDTKCALGNWGEKNEADCPVEFWSPLRCKCLKECPR